MHRFSVKLNVGVPCAEPKLTPKGSLCKNQRDPVVEEFLGNAKQLTDMEGATVGSEQDVTISLCPVSWIDSLLHPGNWKRSAAGESAKEPLTVP